ncbi:MAG: nuclear transport factor 2 family protein [Cyclobacteriaceae bacterium]|nr:nuclear transport factor 2 family protein [Cyclobacteriaceae bacterium]
MQEQAFSIFSQTEGVKYVRNGYLYPAIDTTRNQYASWFKSPDAVKQKVTCDPLIYDVLDRNTVLMTTIGSVEKVEKTNPDEKPWVIAYTMVWRKEKGGWKLFHMHYSWE